MYCDFPLLQRCCFCLPLRRGVLVIGYIKILFSALMIALYSYSVNKDLGSELMYMGITLRISAEICVFVYCVECIFSAVLIYGTHKKIILLLKTYYYYSISTILMIILIEIIELVSSPHFFFGIETLLLCFTGLFIQIYLLMLLRSLVKKWELEGPHLYDNQLHQFINGQPKVEPNGVYNPSTVPVEV